MCKEVNYWVIIQNTKDYSPWPPLNVHRKLIPCLRAINHSNIMVQRKQTRGLATPRPKTRSCGAYGADAGQWQQESGPEWGHGRREASASAQPEYRLQRSLGSPLKEKAKAYTGFPGDSDGKESVCRAGDLGSIPRLGTSPGKRNGNPLQHSCLENSMNRGARWATFHGVAKSQTWLSD